MNTLPPKPEDTLPPPRSVRGTSPRASSMRDSREGSRDARDRRLSPRRRSPNWRRPSRDDDRYYDNSWPPRDRDDRRYRPMDRYVPSQEKRTRESRRSRSRSRSLSRSRSPPNRRYSSRLCSRSRSRSRSRHRHRSPGRSRRERSRGSRSPMRRRGDSLQPVKQEASIKIKQEPTVSDKPELPPHPAPNQLPPRPSHTPTGPRYRSPAMSTELKPSREKETRMRDNEYSRLPHRNSRRYTQDSRSRSRSKSPSRSITRSRQSSPSVIRQTFNSRKVPKLEDFLLALPMGDPKVNEFDAEVQRFNTQRTKLETDHVNTIRAVRRAQHELELAMLELRSAEERRKAADRVHETIAKGFTTVDNLVKNKNDPLEARRRNRFPKVKKKKKCCLLNP